jgi:hypothetical protein
MRELLRVERAAPRSTDVRADKDLCVRALFASSGPVRAWFADTTGAARGETTSATSGAVPPRGPACMKKGESLHLVIESGAARAPAASTAPSATDAEIAARAVIFAAP